VFTSGGGLAQSDRKIESRVEGTFVHVFEDIEYGVATDARLESGRDRFLLLLLAVPEAYRGVNEGCRRSRSTLAPLGVSGGLKMFELRPGRVSIVLAYCDEREGEREGEKAIVWVGLWCLFWM
jgi:hypothetical protein